YHHARRVTVEKSDLYTIDPRNIVLLYVDHPEQALVPQRDKVFPDKGSFFPGIGFVRPIIMHFIAPVGGIGKDRVKTTRSVFSKGSPYVVKMKMREKYIGNGFGDRKSTRLNSSTVKN